MAFAPNTQMGSYVNVQYGRGGLVTEVTAVRDILLCPSALILSTLLPPPVCACWSFSNVIISLCDEGGS